MRFGGLFFFAAAVAAQEAPRLYASLFNGTYYRGWKIDVTEANSCVEITSVTGFDAGMQSIHLNNAFCYTFQDAECTLFFGQGYDTDRAEIKNSAGQVAIKCLPAGGDV